MTDDDGSNKSKSWISLPNTSTLRIRDYPLGAEAGSLMMEAQTWASGLVTCLMMPKHYDSRAFGEQTHSLLGEGAVNLSTPSCPSSVSLPPLGLGSLRPTSRLLRWSRTSTSNMTYLYWVRQQWPQHTLRCRVPTATSTAMVPLPPATSIHQASATRSRRTCSGQHFARTATNIKMITAKWRGSNGLQHTTT